MTDDRIDIRAEAAAWLADHAGITDDQPAHARLSPSGASTWMTCPGAPAAQEGLPDETSEFAAEGTYAHEISDLCLTNGFDPFDFVGETAVVDGFTFTFDEDMAEALLPGIEWIRAQPGKFYGEHKVDISNWLGPQQFGTLDRGIVCDEYILISDLKFGRGIPVSPVKNKQLMLYALGFWHNVARHQTAATKFLIHIDQPRCAGGGGLWETTLDELLAFGEEAREAAKATHDPNAPRRASADGCLWCKRRSAPGGCHEFDRFNLELISAKFDDLDDEDLELPSAGQMTPARRSHVLKHRKMIEKWLDGLHEDCMRDALAGNPTDGLKAVEGRKSPDKWVEDKSAVESALFPILGEKCFTKKLITPTQCAKTLAPEHRQAIDSLIIRGSKNPVLVPEEDARPAIATAQSKFDEEGDE